MNIPIFISKTPTASTLQVVDLGFDIAVVLCGVNDGKKFFVGFREKRDDVMFFFGEQLKFRKTTRGSLKSHPKKRKGDDMKVSTKNQQQKPRCFFFL